MIRVCVRPVLALIDVTSQCRIYRVSKADLPFRAPKGTFYAMRQVSKVDVNCTFRIAYL